MADTEQWGPAKPISTEAPTKQQLEQSDTLMAELKAQKTFESPEEGKKRELALRHLQKLTKTLVQDIGKMKKLAPAILEQAGGKIFTFGSYSLAVYGPGSDIDTLMCTPKHVTRDDFFQYFPDLIKKQTNADQLTELTAVPDASVPIIKMELFGVSVDLIFTNIQLSAVPNSLQLSDNNLLRGLSEVDLKCVNGTRVTDRILASVPQTKPFRLALRAVKLWAQRRAVYGNIVGFPGGVAYAMMVAKTCQLYPKATAARIVSRFFWLMSSWNWPDPVRLQNREDAPLQLREWDPNTSFHDRKHLMPVVTPAYPSMNATHNILPSTKKVLLQELKRGHQIVESITDGKGTKQWKDLFQKHTFFTQDYKHYITVISASKAKDAQKAWSGLCQARLRSRLVQKIEELQSSVELAHPFNSGFERVHECKEGDEMDKVLQGSLDYQVTATEVAEPSGEAKQQAAAPGEGEDAENGPLPPTNGAAEPEAEKAPDDKQRVYTTTFYVGLGLKDGARSLDISYAIQEYKNNVMQSDLYDENMHSVRVAHVRNYDLPADVFAEGEVRPTRAKKTKGGAAPAANKKRTISSAELDATTNATAKRRQSATGLANGLNGAGS